MDKTKAIEAIKAKDANAYDVAYHGGNNYSARVGHCIGYYVIIDGKIVGDVWYE